MHSFEFTIAEFFLETWNDANNHIKLKGILKVDDAVVH